ncbi:MAG: hypothetical protein HY861_04190 [Chlamydiia bacterium]|nr:hypothetical protein [Chlamydiia bacterium]
MRVTSLNANFRAHEYLPTAKATEDADIILVHKITPTALQQLHQSLLCDYHFFAQSAPNNAGSYIAIFYRHTRFSHVCNKTVKSDQAATFYIDLQERIRGSAAKTYRIGCFNLNQEQSQQAGDALLQNLNQEMNANSDNIDGFILGGSAHANPNLNTNIDSILRGSDYRMISWFGSHSLQFKTTKNNENSLIATNPTQSVDPLVMEVSPVPVDDKGPPAAQPLRQRIPPPHRPVLHRARRVREEEARPSLSPRKIAVACAVGVAVLGIAVRWWMTRTGSASVPQMQTPVPITVLHPKDNATEALSNAQNAILT